jgi:hypothetical protein
MGFNLVFKGLKDEFATVLFWHSPKNGIIKQEVTKNF